MKKYIVKCDTDDKDKKGYEVRADDWHTHEAVFRSQMCWFSNGQKLFITDELGVTKTFTVQRN